MRWPREKLEPLHHVKKIDHTRGHEAATNTPRQHAAGWSGNMEAPASTELRDAPVLVKNPNRLDPQLDGPASMVLMVDLDGGRQNTEQHGAQQQVIDDVKEEALAHVCGRSFHFSTAHKA